MLSASLLVLPALQAVPKSVGSLGAETTRDFRKGVIGYEARPTAGPGACTNHRPSAATRTPHTYSVLPSARSFSARPRAPWHCADVSMQRPHLVGAARQQPI